MPTYLFASASSLPKRSSLSTIKTRVHDVTTPFVALTTKSCINVHTTSPHPSVLGPTNGMLMTCRNSVVLNLTRFNFGYIRALMKANLACRTTRVSVRIWGVTGQTDLFIGMANIAAMRCTGKRNKFCGQSVRPVSLATFERNKRERPRRNCYAIHKFFNYYC